MPEYDMPRPRFRADDPDQEKQMRKIISWLLQQDEKIRYILNNLDEENFSEGLTTQINEALNIATSVNGVAQKEEIDALTGRVRRAETRIEQDEDILRLKASEEYVDEAIDGIDEFRTRESEVELTAAQTKIRTPKFVVNIIKENEEETSLQIDEDGAQMEYLSVDKMIKAPNMAEKYMGAASLTVGTNGDFATLQEAFDTLNDRVLTKDVTITLLSDIEDNAELRGVMGACFVQISGDDNGSKHEITGSVTLNGCKCRVIAENMKITGGSPGLSVRLCDYVEATSCVIDGMDANTDVDISRGSRVYMYDCELYNADTLIMLTQMSELHGADCKGVAGTNFIYASASTLAWYGLKPRGPITEEETCFINTNISDVDDGTTPAVPVQPTVIKTTNITATLTGNWYGNDWSNEQALRQGQYYNSSNPNTYTGAMWFPLGSITSGTVTRAAVTLTRRSRTGRSGTVDVKLYKLSNQGKSGAPALTGGVLLGTIASGERKSFDIPTGYVTLGGLTGLAIQADDTQAMSGRSYSENYAAFDGTDGDAPVLTVQYETNQ